MIINIKNFLILQLIVLLLLVTTSNARGRRRPGARTEATAVEEVTEKAAGPDQIAMASRTESSRFGMQPSYSTSNQETENYPYELNLVRPESQFPTNPAGVSQYTFGNEERQVDDVETAEEYVAKAMQMYGNRLQEPIRISAENIPTQNKYDVFEAPEPETQTPAPVLASAPVYEKDPVTRSYDVYDYSTYETVSEQQYEPKFETKYRYQTNNNADATAYVAPSLRGQSSDNDRIKAAASSEIPKEEILKQIEKSVIKYMKEMEADGKIIPTSEPKTNYFKVQQAESTQRIQTTPKPKQSSYQYTSTIRNQNQNQKIAPKPSQSNEEIYSSSSLHQELSESLAPNVEFIYKIKARAPLQSMQTSRPYSNKIPVESFDHSAALKNMEEFDLSHVVQEERVATKPKLFFNSDIYQDINSLPYKPEKIVLSRPQKNKEHPDYKGYSLYNEAKAEEESEDSGYPIMNPYQFVFKKEPSSPSLVAQSSNWENSHNRPYSAPQKPQSDYDTYSPKYNNNPEGYGYQHQHSQNHKYQGRHLTKRGKRGGAHPHGKKGSRGTSLTKDSEANVALRPPPKV